VVETLRQLQENWDGSGMPKGLSGEAILPMARIVAVANAFVGMVSARAYRPGLPLDVAAQKLMEQTGGKFDRRPIAALINILDNRDGRARWAVFGEAPAEPSS
jgi:HD-GYP domain-containing protein (c-di-GMP phosphodiesterase class II)